MLGVAAGSLFGLAAVLTKGVVHLVGRGPVALVTSLELYVLVVVAVVATSVQQSAFQTGSLQASLPASTVMEPVVATLLGFVVLGEYLDADHEAMAVLAVAVAAMLAATIALARASAGPEDSRPAATPRVHANPSTADPDKTGRSVRRHQGVDDGKTGGNRVEPRMSTRPETRKM
ncbi:DMT family transporter [Rhodococcus triatomae]